MHTLMYLSMDDSEHALSSHTHYNVVVYVQTTKQHMQSVNTDMHESYQDSFPNWKSAMCETEMCSMWLQ